jgi:cytochrome P450
VDFIADFALPLPAQVICDILGLDFSLHKVFKQWADDVVLMLGGMPTPGQIDRIRTSLADMERYFTEVIEARRRAPREDVVTDLTQAEVDGQALSHEEILGFLRLLMLAGLETTISLLGNTIHVLSMHPAEKERVLADRVLIPPALEEVLRYEPSVHCLFRRAAVDAEVGGTVVPKGALLLVILASAHRDEGHIPQADRFLLDRQRMGNLPFGSGIHFCLGAALARMEARLGLEALFSRIRGFSGTDSKLSWRFTPNVRGLTALPVRLEPVQARH